jgi:hypothetical protein
MVVCQQARSVPTQQSEGDTSLVNSMLEKGQKFLPVSADSALFWYRKALDIAVKGVSESTRKMLRKAWMKQVVRVETQIGLVYYQRSDYTQAVNHYKSAYAMAVELGHPTLIGDCLF